jgi:predicted ATPase
VSDWLSQNDRLNTGYRLERRRYKRLDAGNPLILSLLSGRAFDEVENARLQLEQMPTESQLVLVSEGGKIDLLPSDIGIGIAQLLPVVVVAVADQNRFAMIEQPELHVHPKIQAELGDLFIEKSVDRSHSFLIETHSEHLILRLLRRIRETTSGELPQGHGDLTPDDVAVYFLQKEKDAGQASLLRIDETGEFVDPWPQGFFEERAKELF